MSAKRVMGSLPPVVTGAPPLTDSQDLSDRDGRSARNFLSAGYPRYRRHGFRIPRILIFDPYDQWPDAGTAVSPSAKALFGHATGVVGISSTDTKSLASNDGNPLASASTLSGRLTGSGADTQRPGPQGAVLVNNELYVADTSNNRLIVLPLQNGNFGSATRVLGQDRFNTNSINLIEGREFYFLNRQLRRRRRRDRQHGRYTSPLRFRPQ